MAEIFVRPARREDFPAIRRLVFGARLNPLGLDWRRFLVAGTPGGEVLGCGQVKPHADGSRELASIVVREQARGRGLARALIENLLARQAARPVYLMCRASLEPFYAIFGFRTAGLDEMSVYFRRISRIERLFNGKASPENRLRVMRLV